MPRIIHKSPRRANRRPTENPLGEELNSSSYEEPDTDLNETRNSNLNTTKNNAAHQFRNRSSYSVADMELTRGADRSLRSSYRLNQSRELPRGAGVRKQTNPRRFKPGTKVLREIRKYQSTTKLLIPKLPFSRLVREVLHEYAPADTRITPQALLALQESSEIYLTQFFEDSLRLAIHAKRVTVMPRDMDLVKFLRGQWNYLK
ncbi:histone H3-1-like [Culicoides brevitarsis]|uniref:histone H3-1-like n=1 Tax=Culicoides brevitarsis TaxID=469753 RepID=UPI00307B8766